MALDPNTIEIGLGDSIIIGPQGEQGIQGERGFTGNGISSITKKSATGLVDTYQIDFTDGNSTEFSVSNGKGITKIELTGSRDNIDTYTITYNDETTTTFTVENGEVSFADLDIRLEEERIESDDKYARSVDSTETIEVEGTINTEEDDFMENPVITSAYELSQETLSGKNLCSEELNSSKKVKLARPIEIGEKFYLYFETTSTNNDRAWAYLGDTNVGTIWFDASSGVVSVVGTATYKFDRLVLASGTGINSMLCISSEPTDYEPYCGGIPAPNPDYPMPIENVIEEKAEVKVEGGNLIAYLLTNGEYKEGIDIRVNPDLALGTSNNADYLEYDGNKIIVKGKASNQISISTTEIPKMFIGKTFKMGYNLEYSIKDETTYSNNNVTLYLYDVDKKQLKYYGIAKNNGVSNVIIPEDAKYFSLQISASNSTKKAIIENFYMSEIYEYYVKPTRTNIINLPSGEFLAKIGDYPSTLENGELIARVDKKILDGTENWTSTVSGRFTNGSILNTNVYTLYCTHFLNKHGSSSAWFGAGYFGFSGSVLWFQTDPEKISTIADFKAFCKEQYEAGTPVTIYYVRSSTRVIPLSEEDALALKEMNISEGINNISTNNLSLTFNHNEKIESYVEKQVAPVRHHVVEVSDEVERIKSDIFEYGEAQGNPIYINDSALAEYKELEMSLAKGQEQYNGYTMENTKAYTRTVNGVTITSEEENVYILNGVPTGAINITDTNFIGKTYNLPAGEYYVHYEYLSGYITTIDGVSTTNIVINPKGTGDTGSNPPLIDHLNYLYNQTNRVTLSTDATITGTQFISTTGPIFDNLKIRVWWSKVEDEKYEPFTNGIPAPNPDYPIDLHILDKDSNIKFKNIGKNLFDKNNPNVINAYFTSGNSSLQKTGSADKTIYVPCEPNTTYTIQKELNSSTSANRFNIATTNELPAAGVKIYNNIIRNDGTTATTATITTDENSKYVVVFIANSTDNLNQIIDTIQIERSSKATSYEPYIETTLEPNIPENEFVGYITETIKDKFRVDFNEKDGEYHLYLYKKITKKNLDGTEAWTFQSKKENTILFLGSILANKPNARIYSNKFNSKQYGDINKDEEFVADGSGYGSRCYISINKNRFSGYRDDLTNSEILSLFKEWLSINNVEIMYNINSATYYTLDLGVVHMPVTGSQGTTAEIIADYEMKINAKYYRDFKLAFSNLEARVTALEGKVK